MAVDEKILNEKIDSGKPLSKEEAEHVLRSDISPVEGYANTAVKDMDPGDFDNEEESKEGETKKGADETEGKKTETKKEDTEGEKKKDETKTEEKKEDDTTDPFVKIERELAKPEGQEDLKSFSDREKAYFHQMKRDRKARQRAESELDISKRNEAKLKKDLETSNKKSKETVNDKLTELKKKDPTEYISVAEALKIAESITPEADEAEGEEKREERPPVNSQQMKYLKMCEKEAREAHPEDFDAVMELTEDIVNNNPQHLMEVAKAMAAGENPAVKAYELIKKDPEFATLFTVAKTKIEARNPAKKTEEKKEEKKEEPKKSQADLDKEKRAKEAEAALEANAKKPKTTGNVESDSTEEHGDTFGGYTLQELSDMPNKQFGKLPKKVRQAALKAMEDI